MTQPMKSTEKELNSIVECSICTEAFTDPRVLPCLHTFCLKCLLNCGKDRQPGDIVPCPLCRKLFTVPDDGLPGMPSNFLIEKLLDIRKQSVENCTQGIPYCVVHKSKATKVFCLECKVAVCMMCFLESHKDHKCFDIELHTQIKAVADKITKDVHKTDELLTALAKDKIELMSQLADAENKINAAADKLIDAIQRDRRELFLEVDSIRQNRIKQLETAKAEARQHMEALDSLMQYSDTLISSELACDVVKSAEILHNKSEDAMSVDVVSHVLSTLARATAMFTPSAVAKLETEVGNLIGNVSEVLHETSAALTVTHFTPDKFFVGGVTSFGDRIFVVHQNSPDVDVYHAVTFALLRRLRLTDRGSHLPGMAVCAVKKYLYVSDFSQDNIHRVKLSGSTSNAVAKWSVASRPAGLSVTSARNVLVVSQGERKLQEFTSRGRLLRDVQLQPDIEYPVHVAQLSADKFLVSQGGVGSQHRVCMVNAKGTVVRSYGGPCGSELTKMNRPTGLAVDKHGNVLVADSANNRLLVLDQSLSSAHEMSVSVDGGLQGPYSLCYDESRRRLYIGEWTGGRVTVVDNLKDFRSLTV